MGKQITWKRSIGQETVKRYLGSVFERGGFGHAYLFCGPAGVGKFQMAVELALALHCDSDHEVPCYECASCKKL